MIVWLPRTCHKRTCWLVIFDCFSVKIIIPSGSGVRTLSSSYCLCLHGARRLYIVNNAGFSKSKGNIPDHFLDSIYDVSFNKHPRLKI